MHTPWSCFVLIFIATFLAARTRILRDWLGKQRVSEAKSNDVCPKKNGGNNS
jgi:hypothetical protein